MAWGHGPAQLGDEGSDSRRIQFPDVGERLTMVVDLHTHSVFSDGHVWPKIRVEEALRDGLDGFAVTEHLEYQPHRSDLPHPDRNRAFAEARAAATDTDLIVIPGTEITRDLPAGHINAVFVADANALLRVPKPPKEASTTTEYYRAAAEWPAEQALAEANAQGAFVFINHPYWTRQRPTGIAKLSPLQKRLIRAEQIHGIEVANGDSFSLEALALGLRLGLTLLGVSDVHDLIDWDYPPAEGAHRPVTLVFAAERSADGIRAALLERRTVVWFKDLLVGRKRELIPLLEASLSVESARYVDDSSTLEAVLVNHSDARLVLRNLTAASLMEHADRFSVPARGRVTVTLKPGKRVPKLAWKLEVQNALLAPAKYPTVTLNIRPALRDE